MTTAVRWFAIELEGPGPPDEAAGPAGLMQALLEAVERWDTEARGWFVRGRSAATFATETPDAFARALASAAPTARDLERGRPCLLSANARNDDELELTWPAEGRTGAWRVVCRVATPTSSHREMDFASLARELARASSWSAGRSGFLAPGQRELGESAAAPRAPTAAALHDPTPAVPAKPPDATLDVQSPLPDTTLPFTPGAPSESTLAIDPSAKLSSSETDFRRDLTAAPVPDMSLEQYAAFHTELRLKGGVDASMAVRYGLPTEAVQKALIQHFRKRFESDAALAERFAALVRAMTETYGDGRGVT